MSMNQNNFENFIRKLVGLRQVLQKIPLLVRLPIQLLLFLISLVLNGIVLILYLFLLGKRIFLGGSVTKTSSFTSDVVTLSRYLGSLHNACDDKLSFQFLSWLQLLLITSKFLHITYRNRDSCLSRLDIDIIGRCFFGDDIIRNLESDIQQIVILGAGNDTRLHRLPNLPEGLYEIDAYESQKFKLSKLGKFRNPKVKFVGANFEKESWLTKLEQAGFDKSKKSVIIWEGVIYYLSEPAIRATLSSMKECARGTKVAFDYFALKSSSEAAATAAIDPVKRLEFIIKRRFFLFALIGEPIRTIFHSDQHLMSILAEYKLIPSKSSINISQPVLSKFPYLTNGEQWLNTRKLDMKLVETTLQ